MFHGGGGGGPMGAFHRGGFDSDDVIGKVYDTRVIGRLPRYLLPIKKWIGLGALGMLVSTAVTLIMPWLVGKATDNILQGKISGLDIAVIAYGIMAALLWVSQYVQNVNLANAGQSVVYNMRTEMFDHLHQLSLGFFDNNKVGKLMSRVQNDVSQLQEIVTQGILSLIASLLTLVGIAAIMISMNWKLGLIAMGVVPVLLIVVYIWQQYARRAFVKARQTIATVNSQLQEDIAGVRVVQSLNREGTNAQQFDGINRANLNANVSAVRLEAMMMPTINILTGVGFAIVIIVGGFQYLDGAITIGVLMSFLLYIQRFFEPIMELSMQYTELQRAMASGARIFELLDHQPEILDRPDARDLPPVKGEISFKKVNFAYERGKNVLQDIDLTVKAGETVAIVGQTGSGKSSLVNLIARFYEPEKGTITLDGTDIKTVTQESLRRQIGIVPQDPILFSGTVEENIKYGKMNATRDEVIEVSKAVGAHAFISRLEKGYDTVVGQRGSNLSAGQRQLICLVRALLADPRILILDEATSNVDTHTERVMQRALRQLTKDRTCLTIAHRLSTVTGAHRIIVLDKGRIVEEGSHKELVEKKGLYYNMYQNLAAPEMAD